MRDRDQGCRQPARTAVGLTRVAVLNSGLVGAGDPLKEPIPLNPAGGNCG